MANTKKNTTTEAVEVSIPAIDIRTATIHVVGDSPLIVHKWSEKAKKEILDKQMKRAKTKGHDAKDPVRDFIDSLYWLEGEPEEKTEEGFAKAIQNGARFCFPSVAFKAAAVAAGYRAGITKNKGVPDMREDMVTVGGISRAADIRYRGEFKEWDATFAVRYNAAVVSLEQLVNLFNLGGFCCGLGEWRAEKGGCYGMFHMSGRVKERIGELCRVTLGRGWVWYGVAGKDRPCESGRVEFCYGKVRQAS